MRYSCFDPKSGLYRYYEDERQQPVNADFAVPTFADDAKTPLGVAAILAGRPLPAGAKPVGEGPFAEGLICREDRTDSALAGLALEDINGTYVVAGAVAAVAAAYLVGKMR